MKLLLLAAFVATASAFVATPTLPASRVVARSAAAAPTMVVDPSGIDAATSLVAYGSTGLILPIPALTPAKGILMMFCNILIICTMSIQGKSLAGGTSHDEMVESFGLTWLLAGTSLGHIVGAGAILGCESAGFLS